MVSLNPEDEFNPIEACVLTLNSVELLAETLESLTEQIKTKVRSASEPMPVERDVVISISWKQFVDISTLAMNLRKLHGEASAELKKAKAEISAEKILRKKPEA